MKRLLLISLSCVVIAVAFQQQAETRFDNTAFGIGTTHSVLRNSGQQAPETALREASAKAIKLIQQSQAVWYQKQTCTSCHHQLLPEIPFKLARERGVPIDEKIARETTANAFGFLKDLDSAVQGYDYIDVLFDGWALTAASIAGIRPSLTTDVEAQLIASRQNPDGSWPTIDSRPPQSHSIFTTTAVCARALQAYMPQQLKSEEDSRVRRARDWLLKAQPRTTEDRAYQLFGLKWTGADQNSIKKAARQLLSEQREDGGWSQLQGMPSDAYATGEALVALHEAGELSTSDRSYQRGLRFLIESQQPDGSWRVTSRLHPPAPVSPPYVDVGFPYGHDQFVSIMGTSWTLAALLHAIPPQSPDKLPRSSPPDVAPERADWMGVALTGTATELRKLLDSGLKPNEKTAGGTTALMLAARDLQKVKLFVERGVDVNARAASGVTPLMVASRYRGNAEVVRFLIRSGAKPNADKAVEVRNDSSALFFAVMAGDAEMVGALADAGADLKNRMKILGQFWATPLNYATLLGDPALVDYIVGKGADPNEVDDDKISLLAWATIANRQAAAEKLLARGARANSVDKHGMTPLLYAASINFGDTSIMEKLIAAGADLKATNKKGMTAFELARKYHYPMMVNLLASKGTTANR